jgi:hypothetical protein
LELWMQLARGNLIALEDEPWCDGY